MTTTKTITIAMSDRAPLKLDPELWPLIASAKRHDGAVECQANTEWYILVREHEDGRRIVYGGKIAGGGGQYAGFRELHGGYLVAPGEAFRNVGNGPLGHVPDEQETIRAIRRVAGIIGDDLMGAECIGDLPAQELA